jgi:hypothetical protein
MLSHYAGEEVKVQQALTAYRSGIYSLIKKAAVVCNALYARVRNRATGI